MRQKKDAEHAILLWDQLRDLRSKLEDFEIYKEHEFAHVLGRKWRADFAIFSNHGNFIVEIDGGVFGTQDKFGRFVQGGGRHNRGLGFTNDLEKLNHAAKMGYFVLRFTPTQVLTGRAIAFIKECLHVRQKEAGKTSFGA